MDVRYPVEHRCSDADLLYGHTHYDELRDHTRFSAVVMLVLVIGVLIGVLVF